MMWSKTQHTWTPRLGTLNAETFVDVKYKMWHTNVYKLRLVSRETYFSLLITAPFNLTLFRDYVDGLVQDYSNSSALAMELL